MSEESYQTFQAGDVVLESGATLADARLAYQSFGALNANRDNAIIMPTHFGGTHANSRYLTGAGRALDPDRYFVVIANLFGNGMSSSPSHGLGPDFPRVTIADNVRLQHRLLVEQYNVKSLSLAVGFSMGAVTAYHWAAMFPDFVERAAPICGSAKISRHNFVFLEGMRGILTSDPAWQGGRYREQPRTGLRAMARAWAAWPPSSHFYRHAYYERLGYTSLDDFLDRYWEATYCGMDANNLLAQISTWESADISNDAPYGGDFSRALGAIKARTFVMPSLTDAYFPPQDSEIEMRGLPNAEYRPIDSEWGHWAGSGRNPEDTAFLDRQVKELLAS
jgi:homoserine O-acetyltransferase/O-succinyltransferase